MILAGPADPARLALWCVAYLVYLLIVAAIALAVSALARTGAQAMLVLACLWLVAVVLVPRVGATLAAAAAPVPSADAFWVAIQQDRHPEPNVFGEGAGRFGADVMRRYGVSRREDLPVSLGGLQLEEDEPIGNIVFDRHYGRLADSYGAQPPVALARNPEPVDEPRRHVDAGPNRLPALG